MADPDDKGRMGGQKNIFFPPFGPQFGLKIKKGGGGGGVRRGLSSGSTTAKFLHEMRSHFKTRLN